jgi:hypothetical protein
MSATPPPPPLERPALSRIQKKYIVAAVVALVGVVIVLNAVTTKKGNCIDANPQALTTIEGGSEPQYAPLQLANGKAIAVTLTYPSGDQVDGYVVAATTPTAGVGVWAMDAGAYSGGNGNIQAVDFAARSTTMWGTDLPANLVSNEDVNAAVDCVSS